MPDSPADSLSMCFSMGVTRGPMQFRAVVLVLIIRQIQVFPSVFGICRCFLLPLECQTAICSGACATSQAAHLPTLSSCVPLQAQVNTLSQHSQS